MKFPTTVAALEKLGRVRLSPSFFLRDFLFSNIAATHSIPNVPDDPDLAIAAGTRPDQKIAFKFSVHVEHKDGRLGHYGHLDISANDPR